MQSNKNATLATGLALAFFAGLWLRIHLLTSQVFIDDEWHGLYYVIGKSPWFLLTHFSIPGATCIPLNLYTWALGASVGWSETWLRLPALLCGAIIVVVAPWLAKELVGARRALWLGGLLAISPLLIFYSRICRPYSAVALLTFVALLAAARWMRSGGRRWAMLFAGTGVLAVYFHLFAVVAVGTPVLAALVGHAWRHFVKNPGGNATAPSLRQWLMTTAVIMALATVLVLPAFIGSLQSTFFKVALTGTFRWQAWPEAAQLVSGTGVLLLTVLFWLAVVVGVIEQCRRDAWFGGMLVSLYPLHAAAFILSRPDAAQSAIVLARYCIPLLPVSLLFAACGAQATLGFIARRVSLRPVLQGIIALAGIAALALAGPLPQCYVTPNNFTSHGAFQHRYGNIDWSHSFVSGMTPVDFPLTTAIRADEIAPGYRLIAESPGERPVVEYPMLIGDHFNPLYYYQHFHRHPVLIGYTTDVTLARGLAAGNIYGNTYVDQVMSVVRDRARLHFQNMVCMDDLAAMRARKVEFVILHKRFEAQLPAVAPPSPDLKRLQQIYQTTIGDPVYEDAHVAIFHL